MPSNPPPDSPTAGMACGRLVESQDLAVQGGAILLLVARGETEITIRPLGSNDAADLIAIGPDEWTILGDEATTHWHIDVKGDRAECTLYPPGEFAVSFREALSTWIDARSR